MAYTFLTSVQAGSSDNTNVTTGSITTTSATLIVINLSWYYGVTANITPTDSNSNTWTGLTVQTEAANVKDRLFYAYAPTVGAGHTFSTTGASAFPSIQVLAFSGAVSSPFDLQTGAVNSSASSLATGSITPSENNEVVIAGLSNENDGGSTQTINGGFTAVVTPVGTGHEGGGIAYLIQTTATAANPTWTIAIAQPMAVTIASFKDTAGGGGGTVLGGRISLLGVGR